MENKNCDKNVIKLKVWQILLICLIILILIVITIINCYRYYSRVNSKNNLDTISVEKKDNTQNKDKSLLIDIVFTPVEHQDIEYKSHLCAIEDYIIYTWGGNYELINYYDEETDSYYDVSDFIKKVKIDADNNVCEFETEDIYTAYYYDDYSILLYSIKDNTYNVVITRNNKNFDVIEEYKRHTEFKAQIKDNYTVRGLDSNNEEDFQKDFNIYGGLSNLEDSIFSSKNKQDLKIGDIIEIDFSGQINDNNSLFEIYKIEYINKEALTEVKNISVKKELNKLSGKFVKEDDSSGFIFYSNGKFISTEHWYGTYTIENNILKYEYIPTIYQELQGELQLKVLDETKIVNEYTNEVYNFTEFEDNIYEIFQNHDAGIISSINFRDDNTFSMYEIYEEYIGTYFKQENKIICNVNELDELFDGQDVDSNKIPVQITLVFEEEAENFIKLVNISTNERITLTNSLNNEYCRK